MTTKEKGYVDIPKPEPQQDRMAWRTGRYLGDFAHTGGGGDIGDYHADSSANRMYFMTENGRIYTSTTAA